MPNPRPTPQPIPFNLMPTPQATPLITFPPPHTPKKPSKPPKKPNRIESALKDMDRQELIKQYRKDVANNLNKPYTVLTYKGQTKTLFQWSFDLGIPYNTLKSRYDQGKRSDELFCTSTYMK